MADARVSWNEYFMKIAEQVATRSTCDRKHIGAVIVRDKTILSTGYNGSLRGAPHCTDAGHDMENAHCVRTVHAEANAVAQAAKNGIRIDEAEIYVTASACLTCFKLVANCGIKTMYYKEFYRDERINKYAKQAGVKLVYMGDDTKTTLADR
jgi:dCMP deaminase